MTSIDYSRLEVIPGRPYPMGTAVYGAGVRFTVFSRHATRVWLALFNRTRDKTPCWEVELDPIRHKTGDVWSIFVRGLPEGALYKYRMDGPFAPEEGHRFNPKHFLLDPYSKAFAGNVHDGTLKSVVVHDDQDWNDSYRPRTPMNRTIIYETHVRGFTRHDSSNVAAPGAYAGLIEKIPYLRELGVTAVELLPVHEIGENWIGRYHPDTGKELTNYWGYNTVGFFAPAARYASNATGKAHIEEFQRMVRALHRAGIEVILDVVFNHTSEGNDRGPTLCFRGLDNAIYYLLDENGAYLNYSGCGNTFNCNHSLVRDFILDCLRYWVAVMHIDGFRFDLASILGRDKDGNILEDAPLVDRIAEDPVLRHVKLIAEAWDAGGAYQVGSFGGVRWAEWNGQYRDDVRQFWRGDAGAHRRFATRVTGSSDLYRQERGPAHSINFVTCHDGFTLRDLVSYTEKHNRANGEDNLDGSDCNYSVNCGVEGETDEPGAAALRLRLQRNFLATLFLSLGVPMLLGGDEAGRTQRGNNNAYCQDNEISWFDWSLLEKNVELFFFCKQLIGFRKTHPVFARAEHFTGVPAAADAPPDCQWFDHRGKPVHWESDFSTLACRIDGAVNGGHALYIMYNATSKGYWFTPPREPWGIAFHTAHTEPFGTKIEQAPERILLPTKSLAVLVGIA